MDSTSAPGPVPYLVVLQLVRFIADHQIDPRVLHLRMVHGQSLWIHMGYWCKFTLNVLKPILGLP